MAGVRGEATAARAAIPASRDVGDTALFDGENDTPGFPREGSPDKTSSVYGFDDDDDDSVDGDDDGPPQRRASVSSRTEVGTQLSGVLHLFVSSFKGWKKRWFTLSGRKLFHARTEKATVHVEIDLAGATIAERSAANLDNSFQIITTARKILIQAPTRLLMDKWILAVSQAAITSRSDVAYIDNRHYWHLTSSTRSFICNGCGQPCSGVARKKHLVCGACMCRVHTRCAAAVVDKCKWTCNEMVPPARKTESAPQQQGLMHHQWVPGNAPTTTKCPVCKKSCSTKLSDFRCLWCHVAVHGVCRLKMNPVCSLGHHAVSTLAPTSISRVQKGIHKDTWKVLDKPDSNPLVVFVNPKSGSNDGVRIMRLFKQLLNPAQVFDLSQGGPRRGLQLFKGKTFRALGCGGDGTIGWILQEADKLRITNCQLGVLPLGTGNDLARILGWGAAFNDSELGALSKFVDSVEKAKVRLMDRWRVDMTLPEEKPKPKLKREGIGSTARLEASHDGLLRVASISRSNPLQLSAEDDAAALSNITTCSEQLADILVQWQEDEGRPLAQERRGEAKSLLEQFCLHTRNAADLYGSPVSSLKLPEQCRDLQEQFEGVMEPADKVVGPGDEQINAFLSLLEAISSDVQRLFSASPRLIRSASQIKARAPKTISVMNNYFGIGLDAKIAFDFGTKREENPQKFQSRMKNQMYYGILGTRQVLLNECKNLHKKLVIECDGKRLDLPKLQGIVILNIGSYMGGTDFWGSKSDSYQPQAIDDGWVEVVGVKGSTEMAACKALPGMTPTRLAQAKEITITITGDSPIPVQVDGEAWNQDACTLMIRHHGRVQMLARDKKFERMMGSWEPFQPSATSTNDPMTDLEKNIEELLPVARRVSEDYNLDAIQRATDEMHAVRERVKSPSKKRISRTLLDYVSSADNLLATIRDCVQLNDSPADYRGEGDTRPDVRDLGQAGQALSRSVVLTQKALKPALSFTEGDELKSSARSGRGKRTSGGAIASSKQTTPTRRSLPEFEFTGNETNPLDGNPFFIIPEGRASTPDPAEPRVGDWSPADVKLWLETNELGDFADGFVAANVSGQDLLDIDGQRLCELGMTDPACVRHFSTLICQLDEDLPMRPRRNTSTMA